jgi:hypothetical protein
MSSISGAGSLIRIVRRFRALAPSHESRYLSFMPAVTLQAHYDGRHIVLDEPYDLPANASLMVTVLPSPADKDSEEAWLRAASSSDAFSFLADPAEDIYTLEDGSPLRDAP